MAYTADDDRCIYAVETSSFKNCRGNIFFLNFILNTDSGRFACNAGCQNLARVRYKHNLSQGFLCRTKVGFQFSSI